MKGSSNKAAALFIVVALALSPIAMADQWCLRVQNNMSNRAKPMIAHCGALSRSGEKTVPVRGEEMKFCLEEWKMKMISCTLYTFHRKKKIDFTPFPGDDSFKSKCSNGDCIWVAKGRGLFLFNGAANTYEYQAPWVANN
ncbi:hypothetical protein K2173_014946 [Erythroxylum novogranatense]|uniref:S-protein homolog n=1 Tax=Erythroxylum novogranatense TaxID=1862640 RepID=A0AAV8TTP3_9ROSI|nr:hypothetical protein K2173_014946 [Erythroxylum novogranatense]